MSVKDFPADTPYREEIIQNAKDSLTDGEWIIEPIVGEEGLFTGIIDFNRVLEERQKLDVSGHYSRPDVTQLIVNRKRQFVIKLTNLP